MTTKREMLKTTAALLGAPVVSRVAPFAVKTSMRAGGIVIASGGTLLMVEDAHAIFGLSSIATAFAALAGGLGLAVVASVLKKDRPAPYKPVEGDDFHSRTGARTLASTPSRGTSETGVTGVAMEVRSSDGRIALFDKQSSAQHAMADISEAEANMLQSLVGPLRPLIPWSARVEPNEKTAAMWGTVLNMTRSAGQSASAALEFSRLYVNPNVKTSHIMLASEPMQAGGRLMFVSDPVQS